MEFNNLQNNFTALNRKLAQTISEKDTQIGQLHQSLTCIKFLIQS